MDPDAVGIPLERPPGPGCHGALLWLLLGLFCLRVVGQPLAAVLDLPLLPPFEAWHGGALPYPVLVAAQVAIVALYAWMARGIGGGRTRPRRRLGRALLLLGGVYLAFLAARLVLGATVLADSRWWSARIPTVSHLVLAAFLLVAGHFHATGAQSSE